LALLLHAGSLLAATTVGLRSGQAAQGFEAVASMARAGEVRAALELARSLDDPLDAARAEMHVLWSAGDLVGALVAGERGLARFPEDLYLLEQTGALSVTLGSSERAEALAQALRRRVEASVLGGEELNAWQARAQALQSETDRLVALHRARARALGRSRLVVFAGGVVALVLLLSPWRSRASLAQSRSSTPLPNSGSK
jgi:hypothetical protein